MSLQNFDPALARLIDRERNRQETHLELIASENYVSKEVLEAQGWRIAPALIAEQSKDRYVPGDDYRYMTLNVRLANELSSNFEMQYELSWQTMDLDALGYDGRQSANGDYWKFTFAPTFKARTGDFFIRPELRLFATYMNWSRDLDSFSATDDFGQKGFKSGGNWQLGVQMETWF